MSLLKTYFDDLHQIPEIGFKEHKTSAYIAEKLKNMGFTDIREEVGGKTGVIAVLDSKKEGPILALRADMDALSFEGPDGNFCYHGCAHDAHSAVVLEVADRVLKKGIPRGKIYFIFQPAEELDGGAASIAESGEIDDVEEIFGLHLRPKQESKLGEITSALIHSGILTLEVNITGVSSHGARPHLGVNALHAASLAIQSVTSLYFDPSLPHSIKATRCRAGGESTNTIPGHAELVFDLRSETNELLDEMLERAQEAIKKACESLGAKVSFHHTMVPAADYDEELIEAMEEAIKEVGLKSLGPQKTPGAEDFHWYKRLMDVRAVYIGVGADLTPGLHDPEMTFNPEALEDGAKLMEHFLYTRINR